MFDHLFLHGMQPARAGHAFHRDDLAPVHQTERDQATVNRAVSGAAFGIAIDDGNGAGPAIAFRATFLGTGQTVAPQIFQERKIAGAIRQLNGPAIENELDGGIHKAHRTGSAGRAVAMDFSAKYSARFAMY